MGNNLPAGRETDKMIAIDVFGFTGLGYYGPPESGFWAHDKSVRFDTKAEAEAAFVAYQKTKTPAERLGCCTELHADLCHWKEGWGPLFVPEYSTNIAEAFLVVEELRTRMMYLRLEHDGIASWIATFEGVFGAKSKEADTPELAICRAALAVVGHV